MWHENSDCVLIKQLHERAYHVVEAADHMDQDNIVWINHGSVALTGASGT